MTPQRLHRRFVHETSGQALTEFALVVPSILLVITFSIWFTELVQIKLKVTEAARFAAWEATAYQQHDYKEGPGALTKLANKMATGVAKDATSRYADMDSTTTALGATRFFAAQWTPPVVFAVSTQEEVVPGGSMVNFIFGTVMTVLDFIMTLTYKSVNPVDMSLMAFGKGKAGARADQTFGAPEWGFNRNGLVRSTAMTMVTNSWFKYGVAGLMPDFYVMFTEEHSVLSDSWRLGNGSDAWGDDKRPGVTGGGGGGNEAYWKQVDRIYLSGKAGKKALEGWVNTFKGMMMAALGATMLPRKAPNLNLNKDFVQATVVSKAYDSVAGGKATIKQDQPASYQYDTAPVCASCSGGDNLKNYGATLKQRGEYFMGCREMMKLGCTDTTSQDNPFGDYIVR